VHVCVELVVAGTQSCQNHLAGPVKKVVCILLPLWVSALLHNTLKSERVVDY